MVSNLKVIRGYQALFSKAYANESCEFSLRALELPSDWPVIFKWIDQYSDRLNKLSSNQREIQQIFTSMMASEFVRSYLCQINNKPVAQVELVQYSCNDTFPEFQCQPDDYGLKLLTSPELTGQKKRLVSIIKFCLEYLFTDHTINRIIFQTDLENEVLNQSLIAAGFDCLLMAQLEFYKVNIYGYSRARFIGKFNTGKDRGPFH
jgi:hypothetical protein